MATVGQQLTTPEAGWRRYDDTHAGLTYTGSWYTATSTSYYSGSVKVTTRAADNNYITFTFYGTKIRLIADLYQDRHSDNAITIDGVSETFSEYRSGSTSLQQAIVYEKTDLPLAFHTVSVTVGHNRVNFIMDAIDIDETGYLYGYTLSAPEIGWKRYDDGIATLKRAGTWVYDPYTAAYQGAVRYTVDVNAKIEFRFYGTKLRILANTFTNKPTNIPVIIDGITEAFNENNSGGQQILVYEKTNLTLDYHSVILQSPSNLGSQNWNIDAIDIDSTGRLYHPDEVTDMANITVGKRIRCHYSSPASGVGGSINNLGKETSDFIPAASSAIPNGDFYFIATEIVNQKIILVADRNVQHTISWDVLNNSGIASNTGNPLFHDPTSSIVNYFPMNESSGVTVFDEVGSSNGTATGTTIISGWNGIGYARSFNGTSDHIRFANNPLIPTGKKSIRLKIRVPSVPTSIGYVFSNVDNSLTQHGMGMSVNTDGKLRIWGANATSGYRYDLTTLSSICDNVWHDVLFTWDGTTSQNGAKLYVDDMVNPIAQATSSSAEPTTYYAAGTTFGRLGGTATVYYLRCDLDSVEIYNDVINTNNSAPELANRKWTIRLLTGGTSSTDTDNEWNKYIVSSNLNGAIVPGDDNVWNWNVGANTWTSTTISGTPANRVVRGITNSITSFGSNPSSTSTSAKGFRPVLVIEDLFNYDKTEIVSSITIPYRNDIASMIYVYRDEYFDGTTSVTQRKSYLNVPHRNDMMTSLSVNPNGFMKGNVAITPISWLYLDSSIEVKLPSNIFSYISVKPHNKMTGTVEIFQPPVTTVDLFPLQDAFIRSLVPKLNYGTEQEMLVGVNPNTGEYYKSLIKFDISSIPLSQKIKSAFVNVYYDDINDIPVNLSMFEALGTWTETGVTWANTPTTGNITSTIQTPDQNGYISFDVKENISDWYNGLKINDGWIIDAENATETYKLYTKERAVNKPYITIEYFDPIAKSTGIVDIPVTLTVVQNKHKDINSSIIVTSSRRTDDFTTHLHVLNRDMLESFLAVNKAAMPGTIVVRRDGFNTLSSSMTIRGRKTNDFDSNIKVSRPVLISSIKVRGNSDAPLTTYITIRKAKTDDLRSYMSVGKPWINTSISVVTSSYLSSSITVNKQGEKSLSSSITVRKSDASDFGGSVNIWIPSLLSSNISVISGFLYSSITVPYKAHKDISSRITVREKYASDMTSYIGIYRLDSIEGFIQVVQNGGNSGFVIII